MIRFMGDCSPSPCHPIGLVQEYLSHLLFQKTTDKSIFNYNNYQARKCKTQPPHIISPCKSLPVDDDSPWDFSNCDDNHSPSYSPSPFIPEEDPDPITMPSASTTTRILPHPAPTTPVCTSCPKHCYPSCNISCLICSFFDYQHPSPVCQWLQSRSFQSESYPPEYNKQFLFSFSPDDQNKIMNKDIKFTKHFEGEHKSQPSYSTSDNSSIDSFVSYDDASLAISKNGQSSS
jgi:hypothetical protein